jgi:hypothetical protein
MSVVAELKVELSGTFRGVADVFGQPLKAFTISDIASFLPGGGVGQANILWDQERTIAASANDDLDLNGSLLTDFGTPANFTAIRAIVIKALPGNTNNVVIGGAASNQFVGPFGAAAHTIALRPGEEFVISNRGAGWTVTPGTGDILRIANGGAGSTVTYQIAIIGS